MTEDIDSRQPEKTYPAWQKAAHEEAACNYLVSLAQGRTSGTLPDAAHALAHLYLARFAFASLIAHGHTRPFFADALPCLEALARA